MSFNNKGKQPEQPKSSKVPKIQERLKRTKPLSDELNNKKTTSSVLKTLEMVYKRCNKELYLTRINRSKVRVLARRLVKIFNEDDQHLQPKDWVKIPNFSENENFSEDLELIKKYTKLIFNTLEDNYNLFEKYFNKNKFPKSEEDKFNQKIYAKYYRKLMEPGEKAKLAIDWKIYIDLWLKLDLIFRNFLSKNEWILKNYQELTLNDIIKRYQLLYNFIYRISKLKLNNIEDEWIKMSILYDSDSDSDLNSSSDNDSDSNSESNNEKKLNNLCINNIICI